VGRILDVMRTSGKLLQQAAGGMCASGESGEARRRVWNTWEQEMRLLAEHYMI